MESSHLGDPTPKAGAIDYNEVGQRKLPLIIEAARSFFRKARGDAPHQVERFCSENSWWLEDFVLFDALRERYARQCWNRWPRELARRQAAGLATARQELGTA